jgi:hypothetical protein
MLRRVLFESDLVKPLSETIPCSATEIQKGLRSYNETKNKTTLKGVLFRVHRHSKGVLHATSRGPLLHCDPKSLVRLRPLLH